MRIKKHYAALLCMAVFICAMLPYLQTVRFDFIGFDDDDYVKNNPLVRDGLTIQHVGQAWSTVGYAANWHPLTWMSLMTDVTLFGQNPRAMHLHNAGLHGLNTALLFLLLCAMLAPGRPSTAVGLSAALAALFWGMHPLRVEVVAWITERKELLAMFWSLLALRLHIASLQRGRLGVQLYGGALVCGMLALASKPVAVSLPVIILAYEWAREGRVRWLRWTPYAALALGCCVLTLLAQREAMAPTELVGLWARLLNAVQTVGVYLWQTVWPVRLGCFYPLARTVQPAYLALGLGAGMIGMTTMVWALWQSQTGHTQRVAWAAPALVGGIWFLAGLVPMLGIVQVGSQAHADRYTYWPGCGLAVILAWGVVNFTGRAVTAQPPPASAHVPGKRDRRGGLIATLCVMAVAWLITLATLTWRQVWFWQDTLTLFTHTYAVTKGNGWAACALGDAYARMGRFAEAEAFYRQSITIRPNEENLAALAILKATCATDNNFDEAYDLANRALAHKADDPTANEAMGLIALRMNAWQPAEEYLIKSMQRKIYNPVTLEWLAMAQYNQKKYQQACASYARAMVLLPDNAGLRAKHAQALRAAGAQQKPALRPE